MTEEKKIEQEEKNRHTCTLVTQGIHRFYTLTLMSDLLAKICFVITREESPVEGFQRVLDRRRAQEIADYIDAGNTIPTSIILSAQEEAEVELIGRGRIIEFYAKPKSFLVLDGQHRVWGFALAKNKMRVPVVIYSGLTRQQEAQLFIDINTKQRPVPNQLILDIKKLAEAETDVEQLTNDVFDLFNRETDSPLLGMLSPATKASNKLSRVTFKEGLKSVLEVFEDKDSKEIYDITSAYLKAFLARMRLIGVEDLITKPVIFRAAMKLFNDIAPRVKYQFDSRFTPENFYQTLEPVFEDTKPELFTGSRATIESIYKKLSDKLRKSFKL